MSVQSVADQFRQSSLHKDIVEWVLGALSQSHPDFNGLPPCPYAKEAIVGNKVAIFAMSAKPALQISQICREFEAFGAEVVVLVDDHQTLEMSQMQKLVFRLREELAPLNFWIMYDHPKIEERIGSFDVSFHKAPLLFIQKLDELCAKADKLQTLDYYGGWAPDYFKRVFLQRKLHAKKYKHNAESVY
jgi:hypothetical protein